MASGAPKPVENHGSLVESINASQRTILEANREWVANVMGIDPSLLAIPFSESNLSPNQYLTMIKLLEIKAQLPTGFRVVRDNS